MKTIAELQAALEERSASIMIHIGSLPGPPWVVWLYSPDDPGVSFKAEGDDLDAALDSVVTAWGVEDEDDDPEPEPTGGGGEEPN